MAKKPKSKVIKRSPKKVEVVKSSGMSREAKEGLTVFGIIGAVVLGLYLLICGVPDFSGKPDIEIGQCYSNRAYQYVQVTAVWSSLNEINFREMNVRSIKDIDDNELGWYLTPVNDYKYRIERTKEFVDANYTLVPCRNLYSRE